MGTDGDSVDIIIEVTDGDNPKWIRKVQDDVDRWFTLQNPKTKSFLHAEQLDTLKATSKHCI